MVILGSPAVGESYQQEYYEGEAEDRARVLRLDVPVSIEFGEFDGCMKTKEYTPLAPGEVEHKYYCRLSEGGFGLMLVEELKGRTRRVEYVGATLPGGLPDEFPTTDVCADQRNWCAYDAPPTHPKRTAPPGPSAMRARARPRV